MYERRCDLSPDGRHLIYFAMNGRWKSEMLGSWTAVSKAPYVKVLGLWPKGDCWHGGGLFITNDTFWLNGGSCARGITWEAPGLAHQYECPWPRGPGYECPAVYYVRLQRDGWTLHDRRPDGRGGRVAHFSRRIDEHWSLHKYAHETVDHPVGRGCYFDEHMKYNESRQEGTVHSEWEWADVDGQRIVWASQGVLFSGHLARNGMADTRQLFDARTVTYERIQAPY